MDKYFSLIRRASKKNFDYNSENKKLFDKYFKLKDELYKLEQEKQTLESEAEKLKTESERLIEINTKLEQINIQIELKTQELIELRNIIATINMNLVSFIIDNGGYFDINKTNNFLKYLPEQYERLDRLQEGYIALLRAIETYDPTKGKFSTYAFNIICFKVYKHAFLEKKPSTQVEGLNAYYTRGALDYSIYKNKNVVKLKKALKELEDELIGEGIVRKPTIQEIADRMNISAEDVLYFLILIRLEFLGDIYEAGGYEPQIQVESAMKRNIWIAERKRGSVNNVSAGIEGEPVQYNTDGVREWTPTPTNMPEEIEIHKALLEVLESELSKLNYREQYVILQFYGFDKGIPKTLQEIGDRMGITRERVGQIKSAALEKLKRRRIGLLRDFGDVNNETCDLTFTPEDAAEVEQLIDKFQRMIEESQHKIDIEQGRE